MSILKLSMTNSNFMLNNHRGKSRKSITQKISYLSSDCILHDSCSNLLCRKIMGSILIHHNLRFALSARLTTRDNCRCMQRKNLSGKWHLILRANYHSYSKWTQADCLAHVCVSSGRNRHDYLSYFARKNPISARHGSNLVSAQWFACISTIAFGSFMPLIVLVNLLQSLWRMLGLILSAFPLAKNQIKAI